MNLDYLAIFALQHGDVTEGVVPLPDTVFGQPDGPLLPVLAEREGKQRVRDADEGQRSRLDLVVEHLAPLLVPKPGLVVVESPWWRWMSALK